MKRDKDVKLHMHSVSPDVNSCSSIIILSHHHSYYVHIMCYYTSCDSSYTLGVKFLFQ